LENTFYFVTGTDTDVGKTVLSLLLMQTLIRQGKNPFYIKPFQTGCRHTEDRDSDALVIYKTLDSLNGKTPADSMLYCFESAKAPFFAARDQKTRIDPARALAFIRKKAKTHDVLVVEGAGGLHVPVTEELRIIDLIREWKMRPLLAARAGLGTINHCLLSLEALSYHGIENPGLVFIKGPGDDTPPDMIRENMEAVEHFSGHKAAGLIPRIPDFSQIDPQIFDVIERLIG
jgi:dethiobiotin synthetase